MDWYREMQEWVNCQCPAHQCAACALAGSRAAGRPTLLGGLIREALVFPPCEDAERPLPFDPCPAPPLLGGQRRFNRIVCVVVQISYFKGSVYTTLQYHHNRRSHRDRAGCVRRYHHGPRCHKSSRWKGTEAGQAQDRLPGVGRHL